MGRHLRGPRRSRCRVDFIGVFLAGSIWPHGLFAQILFGEHRENPVASVETFSGIDATSSSVFGYAGFGWAFGRDIAAQGFRVKALVGAGGYDYDNTLARIAGPVNFDGRLVLARALAGYLWRQGEWTIKGYAGLAYEAHHVAPDDPANPVSGYDMGIAGEASVWRNLGADGFVSLDASYAQAFDSYYA